MNDVQNLEQAPQGDVIAEQEKLLPQSHVNKLVAREKENAAARARQQVEMEYQQKLEQLTQAQEQRNATTSREVDSANIDRIVSEKMAQQQQQWQRELESKRLEEEMAQVAESYLGKVSAARGSYEDFDEITGDFDASAFPQLTYLLSGIENAGDVVYEIAKNPSKLVELNTLAMHAPQLAKKQLGKLSLSITENRQALSDAEGQATNAPLDRLNPSRVSGSNGKMSLRDLRNQSWLKG